MTRALILSGLSIAVAACKTGTPPPSRVEWATSEAVRVLKADTSSYRLIYSPPEDLAKTPTTATSGRVSPHRE
jgi:hypothetical protein